MVAICQLRRCGSRVTNEESGCLASLTEQEPNPIGTEDSYTTSRDTILLVQAPSLLRRVKRKSAPKN